MIIDISMPVHPAMAVWEGTEPPGLEWTKSKERGDAVNNSRIRMDLHSGTHIDAPLHYLEGGPSVEAVSLEACCGKALVAEVPEGIRRVEQEFVDKMHVPAEVERVLFKTDNSRRRLYERRDFSMDFAALGASGARALVRRGMRLVGMDYLAIGPFGDARETHEILLGAGVVVLEGVCLHDVAPGVYELMCLPVRLAGAEAAPVRAVLRREG